MPTSRDLLAHSGKLQELHLIHNEPEQEATRTLISPNTSQNGGWSMYIHSTDCSPPIGSLSARHRPRAVAAEASTSSAIRIVVSVRKANANEPQQRSAAMKVDWANLGTKLGLRGSTANALANFKQRNDNARRKVQQLQDQPQTVDFNYYRQNLKNQDIVADIEKQLNNFQVKKYDVSRQIKAIEAFEQQAVTSAEETKGKVDAELQDLEKTLKNIETARPFEDLTVVCTCAALESLSTETNRHVIASYLT